MAIVTTKLGTAEITPSIFRDVRGSFTELKRNEELRLLFPRDRSEFVQTNISHSIPFTLRGLHYQLGKCAKLIRCVSGSAYQVSVDVREGSSTFGEFVACHLNSAKLNAVLVPYGFANGFMAFSEGAVVLYEMTHYYDASKERQLRWDCPKLGVRWPVGTGASLNISQKDRTAKGLDEIERWVP